jgi:hypothetical protein
MFFLGRPAEILDKFKLLLWNIKLFLDLSSSIVFSLIRGIIPPQKYRFLVTLLPVLKELVK